MFDKKTIEKIRGASAATEKARKLPAFLLELIYRDKLFKLFVPKESGGRMLTLPQALHLFDEAGRIDGNFGWAITIGSGGGYFYGYMQPKTAHNVFKDRKAVIAGSGHPNAIAEEVKGGYNVTGQWKYASGAPYATAFTANAMIKSKRKDAPKMHAFTFAPKQVNIIKDWNAFGMRATESYSFKVSKAFVPHDMTFDMSKAPFYKDPIYLYPFLQFAETSFASLVLGLGGHYIEEATNIVNTYSKTNKERYKYVKPLVDTASRNIGKASDEFYTVADSSWKQIVQQGKLDNKMQNTVSKISKQTSAIVLRNADGLIQYLGMQAIMENTALNRVWRDMHTACQHVLLVPSK